MPRSLRVLCVFAVCSFATFAFAAPPVSDQPLDILIPEDAGEVPPEFTMRARVTQITPSEPGDIAWRWGGEGLGGEVYRGKLGEMLPVGEWSKPVAVASLMPAGKKFPKLFFLTITTGRGGKPKREEAGERNVQGKATGQSTDVKIEFEFSYKDQIVKSFSEAGPNGGTVGLVIPVGKLGAGKTPASPEFLAELTGVLDYAKRRAARIAALPWANNPLPKKYAIQTDLGGYGEGAYYGVRTSDPAVIEVECQTLRQMGVNGLRNAPGFLIDRIAAGEGIGKDFHRLRDIHGMGFPVPRADARNPAKSDPESGCPFAPGVVARTKAGIEATIEHASHEPADEVWALTVDEIGAVFDAAPEGKAHVATCPHCAEGFREYLKKRGLQPSDFGAKEWSDVKPTNPADAEPAATLDRATGLRTYYTAMFVNYASAKLFLPLREAVIKANARKAIYEAAQPKAAKQPSIYTYALRGNTFLMGGHSLDFFEFYKYADNAFVYETSNRDPRVWHWDSHLCDVGRFVSTKHDMPFGIYVKPHRGAPIQRAMSALARGATMLYWYTYGPDWAKGDTFAGDDEAVAAASKAARLIAASEDVLYGSEWAVKPQIAIVSPRSSEIWMRRTGTPPDRAAAWENAKWIYTALAHAHLQVDAIDEGVLEERAWRDLQQYKVIYINGPNLTAAALKNLDPWIEAGGTLVTCGGGMRFDEANQPSDAMLKLLGLKSRREPEMWKKVKLYGATALESFDDKSVAIAPPPKEAELCAELDPEIEFLEPAKAGELLMEAEWLKGIRPVVGREVLDPAPGTKVLARFADGGAAITEYKRKLGKVYVVGLFQGLEYSALQRTDHYNLHRDLDARLRRIATFPADGVVRPVVNCNVPTVEAILVEHPESHRRAIVVLNWTYRIANYEVQGKSRKPIAGFVSLDDVTLTLRGIPRPRQIRSMYEGYLLPNVATHDGLEVKLPLLKEAEVLLLE